MHLHGNSDLSGIYAQLSDWNPSVAATDAEVQRVREAGLAAPSPLTGQFTTAASVCLLSQLIHSVVLALGEGHPRFVNLMAAVRWRHLQMLSHLVAPGGSGVLITDVVSSDTCPEIATSSAEQLAPLVRQLIEARNFFHGVNPAVIAHTLQTDSHVAPLVAAPEFLLPWRWQLGRRTYAVYGLRWRRPG